MSTKGRSLAGAALNPFDDRTDDEGGASESSSTPHSNPANQYYQYPDEKVVNVMDQDFDGQSGGGKSLPRLPSRHSSISSSVWDVDDPLRKARKSGCCSDTDGDCCGLYIPRRMILTGSCFLGMMLLYASRVNVGITMVCLPHNTLCGMSMEQRVLYGPYTVRDNPLAHINDVINGSADANVTEVALKPLLLGWNQAMVGYLYAVFFLGILISQIPASYICYQLPAQGVFGGSILISGALHLILPICLSDGGYGLTCSVRLIQGLVEGFTMPSLYTLISNWSTPEERGRVAGTILTGIYIGPALGMVASGYITEHFNWTYSYYVSGGTLMFWFVMWQFVAHESPIHHPGISKEELHYITDRNDLAAILFGPTDIPWKEILLSLPVWALSICHFSSCFVFFFQLTAMMTYIAAFGLSLVKTCVFSSLPICLLAITCCLSGPLADLLHHKSRMTTTHIRKLLTCLGFGVEAVCLFVLAFLDNGTAAIVFLTVGIGISGLTVAGWQVNHLDLAPRHVGVLVAITASWGVLAGILNPVIVQAIDHKEGLQGWHNVFMLTSCVVAVPVIFYGIWGTGEKRRWADPRPKKERVVHRFYPTEGAKYRRLTVQARQGSPPSSVRSDPVKSRPLSTGVYFPQVASG